MTYVKLRHPKKSGAMPIIRSGHTPIPDYFFEGFFRTTKSPAQIKLLLYLIYLTNKTGEEAVVVSLRELSAALNESTTSLSNAAKMAEGSGLLSISPSDLHINGGEPVNKYRPIIPVNYKRQEMENSYGNK